MSKILCEEIFGSLKEDEKLLSRLEFLYGSCKASDNREKIKRLLDDEQLRDIIKNVVKETNSQIKSCNESNALREKGNKLFSQGKFEESLWLYNKSIRHAQEEKTLAIAVGNRSASLFRLELYKLCAKDIQFALELDYPSSLQPKLFMRLGHCLLNLGSYLKAVDAFQMAEKGLELISTKQKEEIHGLIEICLAKNLENKSNTALDNVITIPQPSFGVNKVIPYASANVHIVKNLKKGCCIYAKNALKAGDVIISEPAYVLVLNQQEEERRCHFCADAVITIIPCPSCTEAIYCSQNCLEEAWKCHHCFECGYKVASSLGWAPRLTLRVMLRGNVNLLEKAFSIAEDNSGKDNFSQEVNKKGNNCSTSDEKKLYLGMHRLISHIENEDPLKRFQFVVGAVILSFFLYENAKWKSTCTENYFDNLRPEQVLELLSTIALRHISQVAANNFLIRDLWTEEDNLLKLGWRNQGSSESPTVRVGQRQDEVASAIYITSSMLNHSCRPNSSHSYYKQHLIVKASEDIPIGREVCIHYGQEYTRVSRKDRIKFLKGNCFFECECEACSNPSQYNSQRSRAYCCPHCKGPLVLTGEEGEEDAKSEMKCLDCGRDLNKKEYFDNGVDSGYFRYFKGMKALEGNDIEGALWNFLESKKMLQKFLFHHNISFAKVLDRIAFCYSKQEKYEEGQPYLTDSISVLEKNFGSESIEVAFELQKMIDLLFASMLKVKEEALKRNKYQLAIDYIERSTKILQLQGGPWFHALRDLKMTKQKMDTFMKNDSHSF